MERPVRVAHVIGKLNAGGVEAVVNNYYKHMDRSKYQFDFIIDEDSGCEPPEELKRLGARYFVVPPYQHLPAHVKALKKLFKENSYLIVHSGMNTLAPISMYAAKSAGVPVRINHNHSTAGKGETKKNILKYMLRPFARCFATSYAACSDYAGTWLYGRKAMEDGSVTVFNNAIDLDKYAFDRGIRAEVRSELGIGEQMVIGHVGRFCFQKNHDFLIDIFEQIHRLHPDSVLVLVGLGELEEDIRKKVDALGLADHVRFLGVRNDVNRLYQAMDVFILPSRYEGLPVVGVEAQASGLPCLFSDAMTKEVLLAGNAAMLSLSEAAGVWAEKAVSLALEERTDRSGEVRTGGFDIRLKAKELEKFYDKELERLSATQR